MDGNREACDGLERLRKSRHQMSTPPPKEKKLRKKLEAANAIDRLLSSFTTYPTPRPVAAAADDETIPCVPFQFPPFDRIETAERIVEQQHVRIVHQRPREQEPFGVAVSEGVERIVSSPVQAGHRQGAVDRRPERLAQMLQVKIPQEATRVAMRLLLSPIGKTGRSAGSHDFERLRRQPIFSRAQRRSAFQCQL
jgi:hypothetical protein